MLKLIKSLLFRGGGLQAARLRYANLLLKNKSA